MAEATGSSLPMKGTIEKVWGTTLTLPLRPTLSRKARGWTSRPVQTPTLRPARSAGAAMPALFFASRSMLLRCRICMIPTTGCPRSRWAMMALAQPTWNLTSPFNKGSNCWPAPP
ncbi:hypothetical protein D3C87_1597370 [compost metagenome]